MQFFSTVLASVALASFTMAQNTVTFVNQDSNDRTIYFSPSAGLSEIEPFPLPGNSAATQTFPDNWIGNFFSINDGEDIIPGMLGEFSFNAWNGITFFDVSAIVNPNDNKGVKEIFPKNSNFPMSGCQEFPCDNCYNLPDDEATKSSTEQDFICLVGTLESSKRRAEGVTRETASKMMKRVQPVVPAMKQ